MTKDRFTKRNIPDTPGVYFFLGRNKEILYIGKATSLRHRIRSYFDPALHEKRSELISQMVRDAREISWTITDSVLEAMILEVNLIRTHKPRCNTRSKDDKSFNHLIITNEEFPRVLVIRGKDLHEKYDELDCKYVFGPFPNGLLFRDALKIIRKLFQFYDTTKSVQESTTKMSRGKIDFNRQIGLYPGVQSKEEYAKTIRHIKLFFEGKKGQIIKELTREMVLLAKAERFEEATTVKRKIFALTHIQDIALMKEETRVYRDEKEIRIEAYDIAHMGGEHMVGVMTVLESGTLAKDSYRKFKIESVQKSNDTAALREVLERRLGHPEWPFPQIIVVDGSTAQKNAAERVLKRHAMVIPVVGVVKNEAHKPVRVIGATKIVREYQNEILLANAEAHRFAITYHRSKRKIQRK